MPKKRVHEIAKEQGLTSKQVLESFKAAGVYVKAASSTVEERDVRRAFPNGAPPKAADAPKKDKPAKKAPEPAAEVATEEPPTRARNEDGKAKVPRAKAIKGTAKPASESSAAAAAKGSRKSTDPADPPASTQRTRAAGGSAAKGKSPGAPEKPAATPTADADAAAASTADTPEAAAPEGAAPEAEAPAKPATRGPRILAGPDAAGSNGSATETPEGDAASADADGPSADAADANGTKPADGTTADAASANAASADAATATDASADGGTDPMDADGATHADAAGDASADGAADAHAANAAADTSADGATEAASADGATSDAAADEATADAEGDVTAAAGDAATADADAQADASSDDAPAAEAEAGADGKPEASKDPKTKPKPARGTGPRIIDPGTSSSGRASNGASGGRAGRSTRPGGGAGATPAGGAAGPGGRRRVVIDSQAARRPSGPPPPQQPPRRRRGRRRLTPLEEPQLQTNVVLEAQIFQINSGATVKEVAETMGVPAAEIIKALMKLGEMATLTQTLTDDAIELLAESLDKKIVIVTAADEVEEIAPADEDAPEDLQSRPPVVTIMGHVDHGKTSLLDAIRETEVAAGEAGGITQHIGAYQVHKNDHTITFIDTPGHQAFTAMRARGAKVTDIAVIVVAADDGVMPQTVEAIDHAKAAGVPIMVAVNKIDKEGADPNRVRGELAQQNLTPADWGGDTEFVDVSAKTRDGLDDVLETIVTLAEIQELKANPDAPASGTVVESQLDPGRGPVATVLVQRGTLQVGDALVAGAAWAKVRSMQDFRGQKVDEAPPGMPVEVLGFNSVPDAGEIVRAVDHERIARSQAAEREDRLKREGLARRRNVRVSLEDVWARAKEDSAKTNLPLIVKADVAGSLEALEDEIAKLPQGEITVEVIHDGVGGINESDVMLAAASDAVIIGFNVRPVGSAQDVANREGVEIRGYSVIYQVIDELRAAMQGLLEPEEVERTVARVEVRETFRASKIGVIAGSYVTEGTVTRGALARLVRDGTVVYDGRISTLRRFKDDVREVQAGFECGITLENFMDVKQGDIVEVYERAQVERTLEA